MFNLILYSIAHYKENIHGLMAPKAASDGILSLRKSPSMRYGLTDSTKDKGTVRIIMLIEAFIISISKTIKETNIRRTALKMCSKTTEKFGFSLDIPVPLCPDGFL